MKTQNEVPLVDKSGVKALKQQHNITRRIGTKESGERLHRMDVSHLGTVVRKIVRASRNLSRVSFFAVNVVEINKQLHATASAVVVPTSSDV